MTHKKHSVSHVPHVPGGTKAGIQHVSGTVAWNKAAWVQVPALTLCGCVNLSASQFHHP